MFICMILIAIDTRAAMGEGHNFEVLSFVESITIGKPMIEDYGSFHYREICLYCVFILDSPLSEVALKSYSYS